MPHAEGICFVSNIFLILGPDTELVQVSFLCVWDGPFPNSRIPARRQRVSVVVPLIEGADYADRSRIRRPHAEAGAQSIARVQVSSQLVVSSVMAPLVEKIQVLRAQNAAIKMRIRSRTVNSACHLRSHSCTCRKLSDHDLPIHCQFLQDGHGYFTGAACKELFAASLPCNWEAIQ